MDEPIISPWIFYFIDITDKIFHTCLPVLFIVTAGVLINLLFNDEMFDSINTPKWRKALSFLLIFLGAIYLFIPSKTTIYQMIAASYITPTNLEKVGNVNKLIDTVVEEINKSKDK